MQLTGNIAIVGDSFCQNSEGWPKMLASKINHRNLVVDGIGGAGWWPIRDRLLSMKQHTDFFNDVELLIYIHTQKDRLFTVNRELFTVPAQHLPLRFSNQDIDEKTLAVSLYYKYLHDVTFTQWVQEQWFVEFSEICKNIPKIINLFFDPPPSDILPPGIIVNTSLLDLALIQHTSHEQLRDDGLRGFLNHFSLQNNQVFADQLYEIIQGNQNDFDRTKFIK